MIGNLWHDYLYTPLLNVLFYLYAGPAFGNLGWAVVELTVLLRLALLPFTIMEERSSWRYEQLQAKLETVARDFKNDTVRRKEKVRQLLQEHRISYWAKTVVLAIQALVLILLYQVFMGGIRFTAHELLYSWVSPPMNINTLFYGVDLSSHNLPWAVACGAFLMVNIYRAQSHNHHPSRSDLYYLVGFPIFTFAILWILPMVKSLFIMTTMIFTQLVHLFRYYFFQPKD